MKLRVRKRIVAFSLVFVVFGLLFMSPIVRALSLNYNDGVWQSLTIAGPDFTKPGNNEIFTVSGKLLVAANVSIHVTFSYYNSSQIFKSLFEDNALSAGTYSAGSSFIKSYPISIPSDAANNRYVYVTIDDFARNWHLSNYTISLIQNPNYTDLQSNASSLQSQVNTLQSQFANMQANNTSLQSQVNSLQASNTALQSQVNGLQANNTSLQALLNILLSNSSSLQSQIVSLQDNNTALQSQVNDLQINNTSLQTSVNSLVLQVVGLQLNNTGLQSNIAGLQNQIANLSSQINILQSQQSDLHAQNNAITTLLYIATIVAALFIVATAYVVYLTIRKPKTKQTAPFSN
jgi:peptidoglycan hydrolase CwlO-like protein